MAPRPVRGAPSLGRLAALRVTLVLSICFFLWTLDILSLVGSRGLSLLVFGVYVCTGGHYTLYLVWHTLPRDHQVGAGHDGARRVRVVRGISCSVFFPSRGAFRYLRLLALMYSYQRRNLTVPRAFSQTVAQNARRKCLVHLDTSWTFLDLEEYSNKVANFFLVEGYKPGDCIALQMHNRPVSWPELGELEATRYCSLLSGVRWPVARLCQDRRRPGSDQHKPEGSGLPAQPEGGLLLEPVSFRNGGSCRLEKMLRPNPYV